MQKTTRHSRKQANGNGARNTFKFLTKEEITRIARKAARLTEEGAKLLVIPKSRMKISKPDFPPKTNLEKIRYAVAVEKEERELLLTYYRRLHAKDR